MTGCRCLLPKTRSCWWGAVRRGLTCRTCGGTSIMQVSGMSSLQVGAVDSNSGQKGRKKDLG